MATDTGDNLLEPTVKPETNYRFLLMLVAILNGVQRHAGLLRCAIASSSNEHRLGANEAPPGIISAFLGDHLNEVLNSIEDGRELRNFSQPEFHSVKLGGTRLDLKISTLPSIDRDLTDRNRTSPFAFTGNKFEFRAVGSNQSPSFPVSVLNAAVASSLKEICEALNAKKGSKPNVTDEDKVAVIKEFIKKTRAVRFEGNNYSDEWVKEAEKRGLPNIKACPAAFKQLLEPVNAKMLESTGVLTSVEVHSRYHILVERYAKDLVIEANTLLTMVNQSVLPAAYTYRKELAESLKNMKEIGVKIDTIPEKAVLDKTTDLVSALNVQAIKLETSINAINNESDPEKQADLANKQITIILDDVREKIDKYVFTLSLFFFWFLIFKVRIMN